MEHTSMCFKPVTPIPTFILGGGVVCLISISTNWEVATIIVFLFAYIIYKEIPYLRETLKTNADCIIIQNVDCFKDEKKVRLKEVSVEWSDIQSLNFEIERNYHFLIIKTKNKYLVPSSIYYKDIGHYYLTSKRRQQMINAIYQLYRNHNYFH